MRKWLILRLSFVNPCSYWTESSLMFSAGGLHVGQVHDLLELAQQGARSHARRVEQVLDSVLSAA